MNEHPRQGRPLDELIGRNLTEDVRDLGQGRAAQEGVEAIERELFNETTDVVQIAVYIKGRLIHTKTDSATVQRIMAILTGMGD